MREPEGAKVPLVEVEELLCSLPGVLHARVAVNDWGGIEEVHILADSSRHPKAMVRDVESALTARWGLVVDHKRISVAQMVNVPPRPKWIRFRLERLAVTADPVRGTLQVGVTLAPEPPRDIFGRVVHDPEIGEGQFHGETAGDGAGGRGLKLAAEAALGALNRSVVPGHRYALDTVEQVSLPSCTLVVAVVRYQGPRGQGELLTGTAVLRSDPMEAAVRSVLAATNRIQGMAMQRRYAHRGPVTATYARASDWAEETAAASEGNAEVNRPRGDAGVGEVGEGE